MRTYWYIVGVGIGGVALEYHKILANNEQDARSRAIRLFLNPDKGFDHVEVKRIKKGDSVKWQSC